MKFYKNCDDSNKTNENDKNVNKNGNPPAGCPPMYLYYTQTPTLWYYFDEKKTLKNTYLKFS